MGTNIDSEKIREAYTDLFNRIPSGFDKETIQMEREARDRSIKEINEIIKRYEYKHEKNIFR